MDYEERQQGIKLVEDRVNKLRGLHSFISNMEYMNESLEKYNLNNSEYIEVLTEIKYKLIEQFNQMKIINNID